MFSFIPDAEYARSALGTFRNNRFTISILDGVEGPRIHIAIIISASAGFRTLDGSRTFFSPSQIHSGEQSFGIKDRDGSLTGRPPPNGDVNFCGVIVPPLPHHTTSSCVPMPEWNAQVSLLILACPNLDLPIDLSQSLRQCATWTIRSPAISNF